MTAPALPGPLTRAEGLAIIRSRCSAEDLRRFEQTLEGQAALAGLVDVFVGLSQKLDRTITARHLVQRASDVSAIAAGAAKATTTVAISRLDTGPSVTLPARSSACLLESKGGHRYQLTADAIFATGAIGPIAAAAEALVAGSASTVIAGQIDRFAAIADGASGDLASVTTSGGLYYLTCAAGDRLLREWEGLYIEFLEGSNRGRFAQITQVLSDTLAKVTGDTLTTETSTATWVVREWEELGFTVTQAADTSQGTDDELDALAREVALDRQAGQTDTELRSARLSLQDVVSPPAILALANRMLGPYGPVRMYEDGCGEGDADEAIGLMPFPGYIAGLSPCGVVGVQAPTDDTPAGLWCTSPGSRFFILRWDGLGLGECRGCASTTSTGAAFDDTSPLPAHAAAGVSCCGGSAAIDDAIRSGITAAVNRAKAAGVRWRWYPRVWR